MPDLPVKDSRLSALHLPEFKRDDIVRSLSEMHLPDTDLSKIQRPKIEMPDAVTKFEWPRVDLSSIDVPKALAGAAAAANIGRRSRRPRWPVAVGGLIVVGAVAAVLSNEGVRSRLANAVASLRERLMSMGARDAEYLDVDRDDPVAFDVAETLEIEPPPYSDTTTFDATGYPDGLGANNGDDIPAFEESGSTRS
jgi:hypothetical protein